MPAQQPARCGCMAGVARSSLGGFKPACVRAALTAGGRAGGAGREYLRAARSARATCHGRNTARVNRRAPREAERGRRLAPIRVCMRAQACAGACACTAHACACTRARVHARAFVFARASVRMFRWSAARAHALCLCLCAYPRAHVGRLWRARVRALVLLVVRLRTHAHLVCLCVCACPRAHVGRLAF
jgi:hypothetical protein